MSETRVCTLCNETKAIDNFYVCGDRRVHKCKRCYIKYQRKMLDLRLQEQLKKFISGKKRKMKRKEGKA